MYCLTMNESLKRPFENTKTKATKANKERFYFSLMQAYLKVTFTVFGPETVIIWRISK